MIETANVSGEFYGNNPIDFTCITTVRNNFGEIDH